MTDFESNKGMIPFENFPAESENDKKEELFIDAEAFKFFQNKTNVVADSGNESLLLKFDPLFAKRVSSDGVLSALNRIQKGQSTPKNLSVADNIDFESNKGITPFEDFPVESGNDKKEELFIDAEAFEFLLNQNKTNFVADIGNESLLLKFDPLFAKRVSSDGVLSALNRIQKRQSTVNSLVSPRKSTTPRRNRRSLTFTSPAIAEIDRLLSLSTNTSLLDHDTSTLQATRECNDTDIALTQLRELLAEKEKHVHILRSESNELKERLASKETQVRSLEKECEDRLKKVTELNNRLADKTKVNKSMSVVVEEYERTLASLLEKMYQEQRRNAEERTRLISERDEQTAHLARMDESLSDLRCKYQKNKQIILSMKGNEDIYKKSIKLFEDNLILQKNYELLKQHVTSKLNKANQELEKSNKSHEAEVLKLNAMIKLKELHIMSLEKSLAQKIKANEEMTAICDEIINRVG